MRHIVILIAFMLTITTSCSDNQRTDKEVEKQAYHVMQLLDKLTIDTFKHWGYETRGEAEIWDRLDTPTYSCLYFKKDALTLSVGQIENFKRDFPYSIYIDNSGY